jgi:hypothetical protein
VGETGTDGLACRACRARAGSVVLDLGRQPASDYFPGAADPGPDPEYPLQMWLCSACGLAQLVADPTLPEEPTGTEPAALIAQAADAVARIAAAGLLPAGGRVAEYGSPHGGSWLGDLRRRGITTAADGEAAEVVLDCFGLMHAADQHAALAERTARIAPGGVLLLQFHSLAAILRGGQWNALRHGHYAYYSVTALTRMLADHGFTPRTAWQFELYGGTVLLAASRDSEPGTGPGPSVRALLAEDLSEGTGDPDVVGRLARDVRERAAGLREFLEGQRAAGRPALGYGAASRAVALLRWARVDRTLLTAVVDASAAKQGRRMPGTDIPIVDPGRLAADRPAAVVLFLADLLPEVRAAYPEVEAGGGRWVSAETLASRSLEQHS